MGTRCYNRIFVKIDAWHHNKTAILKFCAHTVRGVARAIIFNGSRIKARQRSVARQIRPIPPGF